MTATEHDADDPLTWARDYTPILESFREEYGDSEPLAGYTVAFASHLEAKSGVTIETLHKAGAEVLFAPSEPQSTHGAVVDALDGPRWCVTRSPPPRSTGLRGAAR